MREQSYTVNLTVPLLAWVAVFSMIAWGTGNWSWLWWAFGPILLWFGFVAAAMVFGGLGMWLAWRRGQPITVTTRRGTRIKQRGKVDKWTVIKG
jgi:hypothetical protein